MMSLPVLKSISTLLATLAGGMFWGLWLALAYSIGTFELAVFLALSQFHQRRTAQRQHPAYINKA